MPEMVILSLGLFQKESYWPDNIFLDYTNLNPTKKKKKKITIKCLR